MEITLRAANLCCVIMLGFSAFASHKRKEFMDKVKEHQQNLIQAIAENEQQQAQINNNIAHLKARSKMSTEERHAHDDGVLAIKEKYPWLGKWKMNDGVAYKIYCTNDKIVVLGAENYVPIPHDGYGFNPNEFRYGCIPSNDYSKWPEFRKKVLKRQSFKLVVPHGSMMEIEEGMDQKYNWIRMELGDLIRRTYDDMVIVGSGFGVCEKSQVADLNENWVKEIMKHISTSDNFHVLAYVAEQDRFLHINFHRFVVQAVQTGSTDERFEVIKSFEKATGRYIEKNEEHEKGVKAIWKRYPWLRK